MKKLWWWLRFYEMLKPILKLQMPWCVKHQGICSCKVGAFYYNFGCFYWWIWRTGYQVHISCWWGLKWDSCIKAPYMMRYSSKKSFLYSMFYMEHWNGNVNILTKFSWLAAQALVKMTTSSAAKDENLVKMTTSNTTMDENLIKMTNNTPVSVNQMVTKSQLTTSISCIASSNDNKYINK